MIEISGSEPYLITNSLKDISIVNNSQIYPDYKITSKLGYTVEISRATTNDLVSNKMDVHSHVAEELSYMEGDVRIFLMEDWMGRDKHGNISLPGGIKRARNYIAVINTVVSACLATGTLWVPSTSITATIELLRNWNNDYFQGEIHSSLRIRPRKAERYFSLDLDNRENENRIWWLSDIPGADIGITRAEKMIEYSDGKLINLFLKTRDELADIPGVGKKIADNFRRFIDRNN